MTKIILATGTMVGYAYGMEFFIAAYGANDFEIFAFVNRAFGNYAWAYWIMISCNVISPPVLLVQEDSREYGLGLDYHYFR
jgi:molybdopterin-containing oxidoreductase family membrane subunit